MVRVQVKAFNETEVDLLEDDDLDTLKAQRIKEMKAEAMRLQVPLVSGLWSIEEHALS